MGRTDETLVGGDVDEGKGGGTGGYFTAVGSVEQRSCVILVGGIAEYPEGVADKVVPEDVESAVAAVGINGAVHDAGVGF